MRTGNVVREPDGNALWIVSNVHQITVSVISFNYANMSGTFLLEDSIQKSWCDGCSENEYDGGGHYHLIPVKGWKDAEILGTSVKDYILNHFRKMMGF